MKILAFAPARLDLDKGSSFRPYHLVRHLARGPAAVVFAAYGHRREEPRFSNGRFEAVTIPTAGIRERFTGRTVRDTLGLVRLVMRHRPDVIWAFSGWSVFPVWFCSKVSGVAGYVDFDSPWSEQLRYYASLKRPGARPRGIALIEWMERRLLPGLRGVTTVCKGLADYYRQRDSRTIVVPCGVDTDVFSPRAVGDILLPRSPGKLVALYVGTEAPYQNIELLQRTGEWLRKTRSGIRVVCVGTRRGWRSSIAYRSLPGLLAQSDVCLLPRRKVSFLEHTVPAKLPEYMAAGRPVVAVDMKGHREVIQDGVNGFLTGDSAAEFGGALLRLKDEALRLRLGRQARRTAVTTLQWRRIVRDLASTFRGDLGAR